MPLTAEQMSVAMQVVAQWRADPQASAACPRCGQTGLTIIDQSARPHAEWYALSCSTCGLAVTLHIALGTSAPTLD